TLRRRRLLAQQIAAPRHDRVADVVADLFAVQAQDYLASLWAVALRTRGGNVDAVAQALATGEIVRSWPMRNTLHYVAGADLRWMLAALGPRAIAAARGRMRGLGLGDAEVGRAREVLTAALSDGAALTRPEIYAVLDPVGLNQPGQGLHLINRLATECLICHGPVRGKQATFVLADDWLPVTAPVGPEQAMARLAERFFRSHGPATVADFSWWSGTTLTAARAALDAVAPALERQEIEGVAYWSGPELSGTRLRRVFLLPGYDEYLLGYRDRSAALRRERSGLISPGDNGVFFGSVVVDGWISGRWRRTIGPRRTIIVVDWFDDVGAGRRRAAERAAAQWGQAHGQPVDVQHCAV
ncbi:MAG: AlkZ family DNA glycosylase, partial [Actinobacteria bacterium]|nr:AlkZ family DNA glycosylase [Actinomycetota bacterium]